MSDKGYIYLIKAYIHNSGIQVYKVGKTNDELGTRMSSYISTYKIRDEDVIIGINIPKNLDIFEKLIIRKINEDSNLEIHKGKEFFTIKNQNKDYIYDVENMIIEERKEFRKNDYLIEDEVVENEIIEEIEEEETTENITLKEIIDKKYYEYCAGKKIVGYIGEYKVTSFNNLLKTTLQVLYENNINLEEDLKNVYNAPTFRREKDKNYVNCFEPLNLYYLCRSALTICKFIENVNNRFNNILDVSNIHVV